MNWFIITTNACNLHCIYCLNEPHPDLPITPSYSIEHLKTFIEHNNQPDIAFYGGEPLLNQSFIYNVMDTISANHWTIQTNGTLLDQLSTRYLLQFDSILVSLDGDKETTNHYRGEGTYLKVKNNLQDIRARGFKGDLIGRMAVSEESDIYNDVMHLIKDDDLDLDHVHWQLDCQWDDEIETRWNDFDSWVIKYNQGITKLVQEWVSLMREGNVLGIVPFIGIFKNILHNTETKLPCEAGLNSFAIRTDGKITFCPLPPEYDFSVVGDMEKNVPKDVKDSLLIDNPCPMCEVYGLCGGRCLFANKTKFWGKSGFNRVCSTVKHLITELKSYKIEIKDLIKNKIIKESIFDYPTYNNTCEIIP